MVEPSIPSLNTNPITLTRHIVQEQQLHKEATGDFSILIASLQTACKFIANKVKKAGIANLYGLAGSENATGDSQKKLDIISNEVFINCLKNSNKVCIMASEENDEPIEVDIKNQGRYVMAFDPLDGSSNIDANVSIGSIFTIWKRKTEEGEPANKDTDLLRTGTDIVAAGYCLYGSSVHFLLSTNGGANGFTLDSALGEFILTHPNIKIPKRGKIYSINEGNAKHWEEPVTEYVHEKKFGKNPYSLRYIGSMVADVHRTLLYGGVFLYPTDKKCAKGKLRILYESMPMSFIVESAGGKSITGKERVLDLKPTNIHERCGIICGSPEDVDEVEALYKKHAK